MLLIFDWDGTLIDSTGKIVRCMQAAIAEQNLPSLPDEAVRNIIGLGLPEALRTLFPAAQPGVLERLREDYARHFIAADQQPCAFFPGVKGTLDALRARGCALAVATGKSRRGLDRVLANLGMSRYFEATRCADETRSKPHPQMLHELLSELGAGPDQALMVGDTEYDLAMANAAGMASVAVRYGAHAPERLAGHRPLATLERFDQLIAVLDGMPGR